MPAFLFDRLYILLIIFIFSFYARYRLRMLLVLAQSHFGRDRMNEWKHYGVTISQNNNYMSNLGSSHIQHTLQMVSLYSNNTEQRNEK
jgi:hypothetical protein